MLKGRFVLLTKIIFRKIRNTQALSNLFGDEDVGGLHVSVNDLVAVDVVQPVQQLLHDLQILTSFFIFDLFSLSVSLSICLI